MKTNSKYGIDYDQKIPQHEGKIIGTVELAAFKLEVNKGWFGIDNPESALIKIEFANGSTTYTQCVETSNKNWKTEIENTIKKIVALNEKCSVIQMEITGLKKKIAPLQEEIGEYGKRLFVLVEKAAEGDAK